MGLGILFIGYFTATIAAIPFPAICTFTGYLLMGYALTKLVQYERWFSYARICTFVMLLLSAPAVAAYLCGLIGFDIALPAFLTGSAYEYIESVITLLFHVALYLSVCRLATTTEVEKIRVSSARNLFLYGLLFICRTVFGVLTDIGGDIGAFGAKANAVCALIYIGVLILNHIMLFSAYMWICDESDVDMEIKDTGISWFDKLRRTTAEKEQQAADETKKYLQQRYDEKNAKNKKSSGKKKRKR